MDAKRHSENPVCTSGYDLPTPPWGNDGGVDPGEPHPDEPGVRRHSEDFVDDDSEPVTPDSR